MVLRDAVLPHDPVCRVVDEDDRVRFLLIDDDRCPVRSVEGVIRPAEMLAGLQVTGPRELPDDVAVRGHLDHPVVRAVGNQEVTRQRTRCRGW